MIRCEDCGQRFGGQRTFDDHRRNSRCLQVWEMRQRGWHRDADKVWHREGPDNRQEKLWREPVGRPRHSEDAAERVSDLSGVQGRENA